MPRFSFGMVVFNGAEFLRQVLDAVYDFAHEIIVVEGAHRHAIHIANPDGSSTDETMEILRSYPDPQQKLTIIQGRWRDSTEQINVYLQRATGDYVWHLDDDEIYKAEDLEKIAQYLGKHPEVSAVAFHMVDFFGGLRRFRVPVGGRLPFHVWRVFRRYTGYIFSSYQPITLVDPATGEVVNERQPLYGDDTAAMGVRIYHYSYITDRQIRNMLEHYTRYRLYEAKVVYQAIPLWFLRRFARGPLRPLYERWEHYWLHHPVITAIRMKLDSYHYDFYDRIWTPWKSDPEGIDARYGASDEPGMFDRTVPFEGTHPEALRSHPLYQREYPNDQ